MTVTLVCDCGKRLKAPGAVPGRVGRCPACGGMLRVPDDAVAASSPPTVAEPDDGGGGYGLAAASPPPIPTFAAPPRAPVGASRRRKDDPDIAEDRGLVRPPRVPESTVGGSVPYPLWGLHGIVLLVVLPPVLWLTSILSVGLIPTYVLEQGGASALGVLTMVVPMGFLLLLTLGYASRFLEAIVIDSAAGEMHHPRLPEWTLAGFVLGGLRLLTCLTVGFAVPGFLALLYWLNCGDLDWADRAILVTLLTPGAVYAQIALAAVVLHDDLAAANPITVVAALVRVGSPAVAMGVTTAIPTALTVLAAVLLFALDGPLAAIATYLFWVAALYEAMVIARVLGNFCRTHRRALGWFADR